MLNALHRKNPDPEMRRRQDVALAAMEKAGIDAIVMGNTGDMTPGMFMWLTDVTHYYSLVGILDKECVAIFRSGNENNTDDDIPLTEKGETQLPHRVWSCPYVHGATYNVYRFGEAMVYYIRKKGFKKIGWVGLAYIPATTYKYLTENLPEVEFVDFTAEMDKLRLVKSPSELEGYLRSVDLHDRLIQFTTASIRPRISMHVLDGEIMDQANKLGAVEFNTSLIRGWRNGDPLGPLDPLEPGDYIWVLIEVAASDGQWAECARLFRLGMEPEQVWVDRANKLLEIQHKVAAKCVPGAVAEEVFEYCRQLQIEAGFYPEPRLCIHGQGLDIVDLPMFTRGDRTVLEDGMFITVHPAWQSEPTGAGSPYFGFTDDFLVEKTGARRLSKTPQEIIVVGL